MALLKVSTTFTGAATGGGINVAYFLVSDPATVTLAQGAVDKMRDFWTAMNGFMSSSLAWSVQGVVQEIQPSTGLLIAEYAATTRTGSGTSSADRLPLQCQGLLSIRTGSFINGRRVRGHWNIPAPVETNNTSTGSPDSSYLAALNSAGATVGNATPPLLEIYSRTHLSAHQVSTAAAVAKWAILRSRRD